jgi:hypothetical protein
MKPTGPRAVLDEVIVPAMLLLPEQMDTERARVLLLAICGQEARWLHRLQIGGPAHGLWQFERRGGVEGVLMHPVSRDMAVAVCGERGLTGTGLVSAAYDALPDDDILAACFARLLLWTDPKPLPEVGAKDAAWAYYVRNWRPGKPHPKTWSGIYDTACNTIGA